MIPSEVSDGKVISDKDDGLELSDELRCDRGSEIVRARPRGGCRVRDNAVLQLVSNVVGESGWPRNAGLAICVRFT